MARGGRQSRAANTGDLRIGGASATLNGVQATTSGDIGLTVNGNLILDGNSNEDIRTNSGNVIVNATGNVETRNDSADAIDSNAGNVTINTGQDILLGSAAVDNFGDVEANGNLTLTAGRDVIVDENTFVDAFGAGALTVTAGRNIAILASDGTGGSRMTTQGGAITLTTGADGLLTVDANTGGAGTIRTTFAGGNGNIAINADRIDLTANDSVRAGTGLVTIQPVSAGRLIASAAPPTSRRTRSSSRTPSSTASSRRP